MNKIIVVGVIAILVNVAVVLIGFSYLQNEINQLKNEPSSSSKPTPTPEPTPTPTPTPTPSPSEKTTKTGPITKPSVPEFTLKYVDYSYDVPPTYGVDEYTGETIVIKSGEHVDNRTIEITIINQPFTPYTDEPSGQTINLYYNIRYKGSFGQEWTEIFGHYTYYYGSTSDPILIEGYPRQNSTSQYTTASYTLPWNVLEAQIDFQVQALKGYVERTIDPRSGILPVLYDYTLYDEESDWSNTQTIKIP